MRQSIEDGVTLEIIYEGRTHNAAISDKEQMNAKFIDVFKDYDPKQQQEILGYATKQAYLEAAETIKAKAGKDMIEHYVEHILPMDSKPRSSLPPGRPVRYKYSIDDALKKQNQALKKANPLHIDLNLRKKSSVM